MFYKFQSLGKKLSRIQKFMFTSHSSYQLVRETNVAFRSKSDAKSGRPRSGSEL